MNETRKCRQLSSGWAFAKTRSAAPAPLDALRIRLTGPARPPTHFAHAHPSPLATSSFLVAVLALNFFTVSLAHGEELPSLFRGMTVGEGAPGVIVVYLKDDAFALPAGIRAGDHLVAIEDQPINNLDDFADISRALAGKRTDVVVTIRRGETRFTAAVSLTSPTVRAAWGLAFVPDYSLHFADPKAARRYWDHRASQELIAGQETQAMRSLLNVLHYAPDAYDEALALCEAVQHQGGRLWKQGKRAAALGVLSQAVTLYRQAATKPLTLAQWERVKRGLSQLTQLLKQAQPPRQSAAGRAVTTGFL